MAECFLVQNGGMALNFKVVGDTMEPSNPKLNTLWVYTDEDITSWYFGADEPETPENGMVWIFTGDYSTTQINALKKNGIHLYLILAKQYISGEWVEKPTKLYTLDGWTSLWDGTIYDNGTFYESITGQWGRWVGNITGNFYKNSDSMVVSCAGSVSTRCYVSHDKPVDLTNFNTLTVDNTCSTKGYQRAGLDVLDESGTTVASIPFYHGVRQKGKCDISKLSGKHYFRWGVVFSENGATYSATVYEIKLS